MASRRWPVLYQSPDADGLDSSRPVRVLLDGKLVKECPDGNAAFALILRSQGQSVDWATTHGGWRVEEVR